MYYLRNNSGTATAILNASSGQLIDGASSSGSSQYTLSTAGSGRTVIAVPDGTSWAIMRTGSQAYASMLPAALFLLPKLYRPSAPVGRP